MAVGDDGSEDPVRRTRIPFVTGERHEIACPAFIFGAFCPGVTRDEGTGWQMVSAA